jgi:hypothetical protein
VGSIDRVKVAGVLPLLGVTNSHCESLVALAVNVPLVLLTTTVAVGGTGALISYLIGASSSGFTVSSGCALTVSVTGTVRGLLEAWDEEMVTVPLYVPAASPAVATDTFTVAGVVPPPETESQFPPLEVLDAVVKVMLPALLDMLRVFAGGLLVPL